MPDLANPLSPDEYLAYASRFYVGANSFDEVYFTSELRTGRVGQVHRIWGDFFARFSRYTTFWAHFENNVYRKVHLWSDLLKDTYDLGHYTRSVFSPAYRTVEFWATHILGGPLDAEAGDGVSRPSAIPILTENEAIRPAIAQVWRDSNWQAKKEILARYGAAMGDAAIMVVDDPEKQKVQFRVVDPRTLRDVTRDSFGNVKAYIIEEQRPDPEAVGVIGPTINATYTEACVRVGESIRYVTYRNGSPYDWREYDEGTAPGARMGPEWTEDYGFVPLVFVQHRDMGLGWGWSELQPSLSKLHELDDMASKLDDWIRITVAAPWLFTGVLAPGSGQGIGLETCELQVGTSDEGQDGRNTIPTLYANNPATKAQALIAPLDIASVSAHIATILAGIQDDHPELLADDVGPQTSGEARKVAREKTEAMVVQRRAGYDDILVRAHQMAISIGAIKGYPGFEDFARESYAAGLLDHEVGPRPVFAVDAMAKIAESAARAQVVKTLVDAGISRESAMRQAGFAEEEIAAEAAAKDAEDARAMKAMQDRQVINMSDMPMNGDGAAHPAFGGM